MRGFLVLILGLLLLLPACGGGGSSSSDSSSSDSDEFVGGSEDALDGTFRLVSYDLSGVAVVDMTFNGNGTGSYDSQSSDISGDFTYQLASNGEFRVYSDSGPTDSIKGQTDGNLLLTYDNDDSDDYIEVSAGIRKNDGLINLDNASLDGDYRIVSAGGDGESATTEVVDINFDGEGTATITDFASSDGSDSTGDEVAYSVDSNGELSIAGMIGQISSNGEVLVFADDDPTDVEGEMRGMIGIKETSGANLEGDYTAGQLNFDVPETSLTSYTSEILMTTTPGTPGTITGTWADSDGTTDDIEAGFTYTVDSDNGNLTLATGDIGQTNNDAFIAADTDTEDDSIMILFGIRKSDSIFMSR